jgi:hypothetical protein
MVDSGNTLPDIGNANANILLFNDSRFRFTAPRTSDARRAEVMERRDTERAFIFETLYKATKKVKLSL